MKIIAFVALALAAVACETLPCGGERAKFTVITDGTVPDGGFTQENCHSLCKQTVSACTPTDGGVLCTEFIGC